MTGQNGEAGIANMIQKKRMIEKSLTSQSFFSCGDPYRIQTCNLLIRSHLFCVCSLYNPYFLLLYAGFLTGKIAEIENACPADFTDLVEFNRINERR